MILVKLSTKEGAKICGQVLKGLGYLTRQVGFLGYPNPKIYDRVFT